MSPNKRIFWNVVATYGRSLFALICGLFTARWVLGALGEVDYGLFGVVGALVMFVKFMNDIFSTATTRFYSVAVGKAMSSDGSDDAIDECRQWFNASLSIHSIIPFVLICIGYPIGIWVVRNFLTIPPDRVETCIWVFRFSCLSCLVAMLNVPFKAMYRAKQLIAELTIYNYAQTLLNVVVFYYMVTHPRPWLFWYAVWMCAVNVIPYIIIGVRAAIIFPECRICRAYLWRMDKIKQMASFAGWQALGGVCAILNNQGMSIVINKFFGPAVNAARSIGASVDAQTSTLSAALFSAFQPAIVNAYGEGDKNKMMNYVMCACKFSGLLQIIFMIPLLVELKEVLRLWLKTPPMYAVFFCAVALCAHFFDTITNGCYTAFSALGRIREYQANISKISIALLPCAILIAWLGGGVYGVGAALFAMVFIRAMFRVYYADRFVQFPAGQWMRQTLLPLVAVMLVSGIVAALPRFIMDASFGRVCVSTVFAEIVIFPASWFFVLHLQERTFIKEKIFAKFLRRN